MALWGKKKMQEENINPILLSPLVGRKPKTKTLPQFISTDLTVKPKLNLP